MFLLLLSTRLVFLVSGGPGRPPLSGHSVALSLRNKLRKQKNDFLIYKARRVDTVSEYLTNVFCTGDLRQHHFSWYRLLCVHFEPEATGRSQQL